MPTNLERRRQQAFSVWLGQHPDDVKIDDARVGFDAGWQAALREIAWVQRFLSTDIGALAREGRRTGKWAYPLDVIALRCQTAVEGMRSDGWPEPEMVPAFKEPRLPAPDPFK